MSSSILVSVLMTAYNREKYIAEAIESVLASTFKDFELIVVDDCSFDQTVEIARKYEALDMADKRSEMEKFIQDEIVRNLAEEKLDGTIMISQVLIRNVVPADAVVESANALVRSKNELKQKEVEVKTAEAESRRMAALANNSSSSIAFMQAQAMLNISEGIKNGRVQTIVVPSNFNALMMNK
jgi:glycosyltransferase involved in cell wall biosynthesis